MEPSAQDERTLAELLAAALTGDSEDEGAWAAIRTLQRRGDQQVFDAAVALFQSPSAKERGRAADILAQLGTPDPAAELRTRCADVMLNQIVREHDPLVLNSIAVALGHLRDARAVAPLVALKDHADENVRSGVVFGLLTHAEPAAVDALIQLSSDVDEDVRDWATFGLGSQLEDFDTPALREALVRRLQDSNGEVRGEALVGLAQRKDPRVLEPLRHELAAQDDYSIILAVEAAEALGNASLLPLLVQIRNLPSTVETYFVRVLDNAIAALAATTDHHESS